MVHVGLTQDKPQRVYHKQRICQPVQVDHWWLTDMFNIFWTTTELRGSEEKALFGFGYVGNICCMNSLLCFVFLELKLFVD